MAANKVRSRVRKVSAMLALSWCASATVARADLIYFTAGGSVQLPTETDGDRIRVQGPAGPITFNRADIRKLVPGSWPPSEWPEREAAARSEGAQQRFDAAWWALENGLTSQAAAMLRQAHEDDARHEPSARLVAVLDRLEKPAQDPSLGELKESLGGSFSVARGPHFVLFHQHSEPEASARIELLEQVRTTFFLSMAAQGFELPIPAERLASVWFARQGDYLAYLHVENADAFRTTTGYYHPTRRVVLAYDTRDRDEHRKASRALATRREEIETARAQLPERGRVRLSMAGAPARALDRAGALAYLDKLAREVSRQELILDLDRRAIDTGTAAHELIHQLVARTGLAPRHDDFPLWLHEGLAMQFEVVRGGRWAGIGRANDARLPDWQKLEPPPRLAPLVRDAGFGRGYSRDAYAAAWALVYYLRKARPREFRTFLDLLRAPSAERSTPPNRISSAFQQAFGADLAATEADWHRFLSTIQTPLQSAAPDSPPPSRN